MSDKKIPIVLPDFLNSNETFDQILRTAINNDVSDVLITPFKKVYFRKYGKLIEATNRFLNDNEIDCCIKFACSSDAALNNVITGASLNTRYELVMNNNERTKYGTRRKRGFRVNVAPCYNPSGKWGAQIVMRVIPWEVPTIEKVLLIPELLQYCTPPDGIVYVAGKTGSGKSTTIAAIIRYVLENETPIRGNLVTHEEPIEYLFDEIESKHSVIAQSQIPEHFKDFDSANREAMRRVPSLVFLGEMRDKPSVNAGVNISLSGHTAMGTIHASTVSSTVPRLLSYYSSEAKESAFFNIVDTARLFMAQRLLPKKGGGMIAAREYLPVTNEVRTALFDLKDLSQLNRFMRDIVEAKGHSFYKESIRLFEADLIEEITMMEIQQGGFDE